MLNKNKKVLLALKENIKNYITSRDSHFFFKKKSSYYDHCSVNAIVRMQKNNIAYNMDISWK